MSDKSRYLKFFLLIKEKVDKLSSEIYLRPVSPMNPGSIMAGYITKENHLFIFHWAYSWNSPFLENVPQSFALGNKFEFPMAGTLIHRQMQTYTQRPKSNSCRTKTKERSPTIFSSFSRKNPSFKEQNVNIKIGESWPWLSWQFNWQMQNKK